MPSRKRQVEIEVVVDDKTATKSLKNIDTQVTKTGKVFSQMGTAVKASIAAFGVGQAVDVLQSMANSAIDLNESINAVNVTFGKAADGILEIGENAAESMGLAQSEFNQFAVQFAGFAQTVAGEQGRDVVDVMGDISGRVADFASVMNVDVSEAGEIFQSIMAGSTEVARRFAIDTSAATVEQYALANGLAETKSEITETDKVLARFMVLMEETAHMSGDFANTSGEVANQQRILQAQIENLSAQIGDKLLPLWGDLLRTTKAQLDVLTDVRKAETFSERQASELKDWANALRNVAEWLGLIEERQGRISGGGSRVTGTRFSSPIVGGGVRSGGSGRPGGAIGTTGPFHTGGMVPGTPGSDQLVWAQAGETIGRRAAAHMGAQVINYNSYYNTGATTLAELNELRRRGVR